LLGQQVTPVFRTGSALRAAVHEHLAAARCAMGTSVRHAPDAALFLVYDGGTCII